MKRALALVALVAALAVPTAAHGGGYDHGKAAGTCSFEPVTQISGQPFAVNAVGLPTDRQVNLIVTNYEQPTRGYPNLAVNPDGTWSGSFTESGDGWFTFEFDSPSTNGSWLAQTDAKCRIKVT